MKDLVTFTYTNWKGETAQRTVRPVRLWFGHTDWHKEDQWLLEAYDMEKHDWRDFAMKDVSGWAPTNEKTPEESPRA